MYPHSSLKKFASYFLLSLIACLVAISLFTTSSEAAGDNISFATTPAPTPTPRPTPPPAGPGGQLAFARWTDNMQFEIYVMNAEGNYPPTRITYNTVGSTAPIPPESDFPVWSPDNKKIAFRVADLEPNGIGGIYLIDPDGTNQTRITNNFGIDPTWSPDGQKIAFIGSMSDIYTVNIDGTNLTRITASSPQMQRNQTTWAPDGSKIAFACIPNGSFEICTINPDGSGQQTLPTRALGLQPAWSPDSKQLAYVARFPDGTNEIRVMNADGSNQHNLPTRAFGQYPTWSPDGTKIVFVVGPGNGGQLYIMNADGSDQHPFINLPTGPANKTSILANATATSQDTSPSWQRGKRSPGITWNSPTDITYGTPLSASQLNATASVPGSFTYTPALGTTLNAGAGQTLKVDFTPTDTASYMSTSKTVSINVMKANQTITFDALSNKTYGDAPFSLSATASSGLPVSFQILSGPATLSNNMLSITGAGHVVVRTTQAGNTNYNATPAVDRAFDVTKATPVIAWSNPLQIISGTALSSTQLNATANVPGTFEYAPSSGTVLSVGTHQLLATFRPSDAANYDGASQSVQLVVIPSSTLLTEAGTTRAIVLDAVSHLSGPFHLTSLANLSADQHTRLLVFTYNLGLNTGDDLSALSVQVKDTSFQTYTLPVENIGTLPGLSQFSYIVVRLTDELPAGDLSLSVSLRGVVGNQATISIVR